MTQVKDRKKRRMVLAFVLAGLLVLGILLGVFIHGQAMRQLYPLRYGEQVEKWAAEYGLDPYMVYAFIRTESSFEPKAESSAGARGLMQMTEDTFDWIKGRIAPEEALSYDDLYQPEHSIRFGCYYLYISLERYGGDLSTAAAAYHSGWGTVDRLLEAGENSSGGETLESFPFTQMSHYVDKINKCYQKYLKIYAE